ncbi:MAG: chemotaxis protein CheW [Fibrobacterales bacterium]
MTSKESTIVDRLVESAEGKYLTFKLGTEEYGVSILKVQRIIQQQKITPIPHTPEYIKGVINLRGSVIPIVELRAKFSMDSVENTDNTCIVVVQVGAARGEVVMGFLIDSVSEVLYISESQLQETPTFGEGISVEFITSVAKINSRVIMLLDINKIMSVGDMEAMAAIDAE